MVGDKFKLMKAMSFSKLFRSTCIARLYYQKVAQCHGRHRKCSEVANLVPVMLFVAASESRNTGTRSTLSLNRPSGHGNANSPLVNH